MPRLTERQLMLQLQKEQNEKDAAASTTTATEREHTTSQTASGQTEVSQLEGQDGPEVVSASATRRSRRKGSDAAGQEPAGADDPQVGEPPRKRPKIVRGRLKKKRGIATTKSGDSDEELFEQGLSNDDEVDKHVPAKSDIPRKRKNERQTSIPKKEGLIPRRMVDAPEKPSLLLSQSMKPAQPVVSAVAGPSYLAKQQAAATKSAVTTFKPAVPSTKSKPAPAASRGPGGGAGRRPAAAGIPPPKQVTLTPADISTLKFQQQPAQPTTEPFPNAAKPETWRQAFRSLETLVTKLRDEPQFQLQSAVVDVSGSFLRENEERREDFFDYNQEGEIVLQAPVPIFPEDFPPGRKEWPLSWWGIVDPALQSAKKKPQPTRSSGVEAKPKSRRDPSPAQRPMPAQPQRHPPPNPLRHSDDFGAPAQGNWGRNRGMGRMEWRGGRGGRRGGGHPQPPAQARGPGFHPPHRADAPPPPFASDGPPLPQHWRNGDRHARGRDRRR